MKKLNKRVKCSIPMERNLDCPPEERSENAWKTFNRIMKWVYLPILYISMFCICSLAGFGTILVFIKVGIDVMVAIFSSYLIVIACLLGFLPFLYGYIKSLRYDNYEKIK